MEELLALARKLRPAVLDDHGLLPALHSQVRDFGDQTGSAHASAPAGRCPKLSPEQQLVIYRVTQESLSNIAQHAQAHKVDVELSFVGRTVLRIKDDGRGFSGVAQRRPRPLRDARARAAGRRSAVDLVRSRPRNASGADDRMSSMRILVADDHGIVRAGIRLLLERQPGIEVVAEAADGVEAVEQALASRPDLCILDVGMPRMTGLQAAREIRSHLPDVRRADALDARRRALPVRGAQGGRVGLRAQARGRPGSRRRRPRRRPRGGVPDERRGALDHPPWMADGAEGPAIPLTPREEEVVKLIAEAHTNSQIAAILHLSEKTVESHRANVLRKLGHARPRRARSLRDPPRPGRGLRRKSPMDPA